MKQVLLVGFGAMGRMVLRQIHADSRVRVRYILVREEHVPTLKREIGESFELIHSLDEMTDVPDIALECAGQDAVLTLVPTLLRNGIVTIIASVGALAHEGVPERLEAAAVEGGAQLIPVAGAIAGIDALSAARLSPVATVRYIGRKPPIGWLGTPAEQRVDLRLLREPTIIFEGSARAAALMYPRNANVVATVALAGIGMERTQVLLFADPIVTRNTHIVEVRGEFGEIDIKVAAQPLSENPKTSALACFSIVRALLNQISAIAI